MTAWYKAEGNAKDIQNGNNGTLQNGTTFATGKVGQGFLFDGVDDLVSIPDNPALKPARVTVDAWVKFNSLDSTTSGMATAGYQYLVFKQNTRSGNFEGYALVKARINGSDKFGFGVTSADGTQYGASSTTSISIGQFYHVAGTYDGSNVKLYVNGVLEATAPATLMLDYGTQPVFLGSSGNAFFDGKLNGVLDEVEIFSRALAQSEIQAIVAADSAGKCGPGVVISEFRWDGPGADATTQANNEFIELYNNTNSAITVSAPDNSGGWAVAANDATGTRFVIPNGTIIPARGHFLIVNQTGYSLNNYPAGVGTTATPDGTASGSAFYTADIAPGTGIALFSTANTASFNATTRLDAVGSTTSSTLYREGTGLTVVATAGAEHSYVRRLNTGTPQDTGANENDFLLIATNASASIPSAVLGAPGPENTTSPVQRNATIKASLTDSMQPSFASPNRVRSGAINPAEPSSNTRGTLKIRRKFTNLTGESITRLRFRVVDITTAPRPDTSTADLRVLPGSSGSVTLSDGTTVVPLTTLTREEPPVQTGMGGGFNTTLSATLTPSLADGASINVEFNLGVVEDGRFRFLVNVEALTNPPTNPPVASGSGARGKALKSKAQRATP
jgi:hypothetical protein